MASRDLVDVGYLSQFFHLPITEASKELGICATALKKICRKHGIPRWPARKIRSIDKLIAALQDSMGQSPNDENVAIELDRLKKRRMELIHNPSLAAVSDERRMSKLSSRQRGKKGKEGEETQESSPDVTATPITTHSTGHSTDGAIAPISTKLSLNVSNLTPNGGPVPQFQAYQPASYSVNPYGTLLSPMYPASSVIPTLFSSLQPQIALQQSSVNEDIHQLQQHHSMASFLYGRQNNSHQGSADGLMTHSTPTNYVSDMYVTHHNYDSYYNFVVSHSNSGSNNNSNNIHNNYTNDYSESNNEESDNNTHVNNISQFLA